MTQAQSQTVQQPDNVSTQETLSVVQPENKNSKTILELTHDEEHQYFLKQESYCSFDLPEYFKFETLLNSVDDALKGKKLSDLYREITEGEKIFRDNPRNYEDVNYKVLNNKDGKYAWRPLQLINPALYVSLVHKIICEENWQLVLDLGFSPVVPPKSNRLQPWQYDKEMYKKRNEVERLFRRLKGFRRIFTRFEKLDVMFIAFIHFAMTIDLLNLC